MTAKSNMQAMLASSFLSGVSANYVEELYEAYLIDPNSVPADWRECFAQLPQVDQQFQQDVAHSKIRQHFLELAQNHAIAPVVKSGDAQQAHKQFRVLQLIDAFRSHGHHRAKLDPLGVAKRTDPADLHLAYHDLSEADLDTNFSINSFAGLQGDSSLRELYDALNQTYCSSIGVEYMHITKAAEVNWLKHRFESVKGKPTFTPEYKQNILRRLTAAEGLEKYLGTKYVGQKRFSLEGGDSLIPLMDELIQRAGGSGVKEIVIGMAHRGRLNVLVNVLGKAPKELFAEFEGKYTEKSLLNHSGDVKYHMGFSSDVMTSSGEVHLALAFNPSHLEIINPVVEGSVRARQARRNDVVRKEVLPILIHGDAAFAGQGVVMETFSLSQARGFRTGGTVHIIVNNQIGFTTSNPLDARSTLYCSDAAKMVQAPVVHVNGDDPEAVVFVTQLALDYRMTFNKDIVIDLVCYRRHGHNEADEPSATQPMMYSNVRKHLTTRKLYADQLIKENVITQADADAIVREYRDALDRGEHVVKNLVEDSKNVYSVDWSPYQGQVWDSPTETGVALDVIKTLGQRLGQLPEGFTLQNQVKKIVNDRLRMTAGEIPIDWGYAETMAYATLVSNDYMIRLVGQDSRRGTFSHRHATLHDHANGDEYTPLEHVAEGQKRFVIIDSLLSEEAVLAFEYGFSLTEPEVLNIWEAQFGDFANGAQVVIDQFISSGEQKWGRLCGLVMFLPHGFEGQGPEHSSARLERFMQLCAQHNLQVCAPSTPAQIFHLLRRQMIRPYRKPLIVMTPKSLLRHKLAVSSLQDLVKGHYQLVLPEIDELNPQQVDRVVICSGKVYYDLLSIRREKSLTNVAIIRVEQLYPFPLAELTAELARYSHAKNVIWCQEEPRNQGAWYCAQHWFRQCCAPGQQVSYAGRDSSASPAVGSLRLHNEEQQAIVENALLK